MTALDVMWWARVRKVARHYGSQSMYCVSAFNIGSPELYEWNELTRENGKNKAKVRQLETIHILRMRFRLNRFFIKKD